MDRLKRCFRFKEVRDKILFTFLILVIIRFGSVMSIPNVNPGYFRELFSDAQVEAFGWLNIMTGGSLTEMSIFALSITPYITSSIIVQLLTIAIPYLEQLQKDGEDGREKLNSITRYVTVGLALIESAAMAIGFGRQGLLMEYTALNVITCIAAMTAASTILMWFGTLIDEKGIGNGISMILLFNIISSIPSDISSIFTMFINGKNVAAGIAIALIIIGIIALITAYTVVLNDATRKIPVQYSRNIQGRVVKGSNANSIPLKVNTAGVIPVIFASSIMSMPVMIAQFFNIDYSTIGGKVITCLNSANWIKPAIPWASIGLVLYIALVIIFAYFYTSITFNPLEVANNLKKSGGMIPGIRSGKPTSDYLSKVLHYLIFIGAIGLSIACVIPIIISGLSGISRLSFLGTSLIIIVSVISETLSAIDSEIGAKTYAGFLKKY